MELLRNIGIKPYSLQVAKLSWKRKWEAYRYSDPKLKKYWQRNAAVIAREAGSQPKQFLSWLQDQEVRIQYGAIELMTRFTDPSSLDYAACINTATNIHSGLLLHYYAPEPSIQSHPSFERRRQDFEHFALLDYTCLSRDALILSIERAFRQIDLLKEIPMEEWRKRVDKNGLIRILPLLLKRDLNDFLQKHKPHDPDEMGREIDSRIDGTVSTEEEPPRPVIFNFASLR